MNELIDKSQLKEGAILKIVGHSNSDSYKKISIKMIINMPDGDVEVLINKKRNYYFSFNLYNQRKSWAKEVYILNE